MKDLIGLTHGELKAELTGMGEKPFREKQLWHWMYNRGETDFQKMTTLAKDLRAKLAENYVVGRPAVLKETTSADSTRKWLFGFQDKRSVETVYIPEEDRGAVCISTQIGCPNACVFCHTGSQKMERNLTAGEIVGQFLAARDSYGEWALAAEQPRMLSNIVVMGMGEPLYNYENVKNALTILSDGDGVAISQRRITLSTSGVAPMIPQLARDLSVKLAISLHAPTNEIRDRIMPINRKHPLEELMRACKEFQEIGGTRQYITMEYVMLDGVNDSPADAHALIRLVKGLAVKFNLIPFNEWRGCPLKCSPKKRIMQFSQILEDAHYAAPVRVSRGQDIMAACGQLKTAVLNKESDNT